MSEALVQEETLPEAEPLVICNYREHPTGNFGCFRCIDNVLLQRLLLMVSENKVEVFSVSVTAPIKVNSEEFFRFLHENNICFKIFFNEYNFSEEYENVKILKSIPSVKAESKQAVVGEQAVEGVEEQPNFLQKFTTYYEYEYQTTDGSQQSSFAFMLEFTDNVEIHNRDDKIHTKKIYIILNKFCNSPTIEQKLSKKFYDNIIDALEILDSHEYGHGDAHLNNVVDCGKDSNPQYKLIDFGMLTDFEYMKRERSYLPFSRHKNNKTLFEAEINKLKIYFEDWRKRSIASQPDKDPADFTAKAYHDDLQQSHAAYLAASKKAELQKKFEIIQKSYPELIKRYRFMVTHYISEYLNMMCLQKKSVRTSYISPEKGDNYDEPVSYPSATFEFESKQDLDECKKELPNLKELGKSLTAIYSSGEVQSLYENAVNHEEGSRKEIRNIQTNILEISDFLSSHTTEETRSGKTYEDNISKYYEFLKSIFKFEDQGGGQTKYKSKRRTRRKTRTRTKSKSKSKNKRRTRTRTKTRTKSKSKSKNKRRTRRK